MNNLSVFLIASTLSTLPFFSSEVEANSSLVLTVNMEQEESSVRANQDCPPDLSHLQPEMETLLSSVHNAEEFKHTLRGSLTHSIPDAITQADGLRDQLAFLNREVALQNEIIRETQQIAENHSTGTKEGPPFDACPKGQKGSYCSAVERYYMAKATNLANQGFLDSLMCYQRKGFR